MVQALYRKYRSKSLSEIVGQEHITDTLTRALAAGRISHAYLFSGPRGVGKTSIARILAHEINGLPYTDDSMHLDIIEIDAASNRRIDEIRELRDKVYMAPTSGKYKVYIIDEVHMLTREAFNALLKTLEEPPAHVVFILATTEAHKLPETIVSRTQHYTFRPVESTKVIAHLRDIAASEGLAIDDDALELLAAHGQGSFRDSISVLDQASGIHTTADTQVITADDVRQLLGIAPAAALDRIIELLANASTAGEVLNQLSSLYSQGIRAGRIASQLSERLRQQLIMGASELPVDTTLRLMKSLIEVPASRDPERLFELILLESLPPSAIKTTHPTPNTTLPEASKPTPTIESIVLAAVPKTEATKPPMPIVARPPAVPDTAPSNTAAAPALKQAEAKTPTADIVEVSDDNIPSTAPTAISGSGTLDPASWPEILSAIKKEYNTLYGVLRMANPVFGERSIELQMKFAFHQKRLNEVKNKKIIAGFIKQVTGIDAEVSCTYNKDATPSPGVASTPSKPADDTMAAIANIFGGGEVI